jgi:hypothetical protein
MQLFVVRKLIKLPATSFAHHFSSLFGNWQKEIIQRTVAQIFSPLFACFFFLPFKCTEFGAS